MSPNRKDIQSGPVILYEPGPIYWKQKTLIIVLLFAYQFFDF